jgi:hypothetical protein
MDVVLLIFLVIVTVILTFFGVIYIYERGWKSGLAEGKHHNPYKIITEGWQIKIPGFRGVIKLVDDPEEEADNNVM